MEAMGTGAGLAAFGFWMFVASAVAAGVWFNIRKREIQHETLRRSIESGQTIDDAMVDKLLQITTGVPSPELYRDLKVAALILTAIAPGLLFLGWGLSVTAEQNLIYLFLGISLLIMCIAVGLYFASRLVQRSLDDDTPAA